MASGHTREKMCSVDGGEHDSGAEGSHRPTKTEVTHARSPSPSHRVRCGGRPAALGLRRQLDRLDEAICGCRFLDHRRRSGRRAAPRRRQRAGKLVIGTDAAYPPNEYKDADGKPVGWEIELARRASPRSSVSTSNTRSPSSTTSSRASPAARPTSGMSSFTDTVERQEQVDFVNYYNAGIQWASAAGNERRPGRRLRAEGRRAGHHLRRHRRGARQERRLCRSRQARNREGAVRHAGCRDQRRRARSGRRDERRLARHPLRDRTDRRQAAGRGRDLRLGPVRHRRRQGLRARRGACRRPSSRWSTTAPTARSSTPGALRTGGIDEITINAASKG